MRLLLLALFCLLGRISAETLKDDNFDKLEELLDREIDEDDAADEATKAPVKAEDACSEHRCTWGKECVVKNGKPHCQCAARCPEIKDAHVCSSHNTTFASICELYRERCYCKEDDPRCSDNSNAKVHLEYIGKCKMLDDCSEDMMSQFGERMADWLFQVMKEMNRREALHSDKWEMLAMQAEKEPAMKHIYPVIWKYCELDKRPHDSHVSHHELIPLIAPVMPLESCIKPFLKNCDKDGNRKITLKEWGGCLGLKDDQFLEKC